MKEIKILYLYPDILDLYGDIGNIKVLKYRLEQRGYTVTIDKYSINDENQILKVMTLYLQEEEQTMSKRYYQMTLQNIKKK